MRTARYFSRFIVLLPLAASACSDEAGDGNAGGSSGNGGSSTAGSGGSTMGDGGSTMGSAGTTTGDGGSTMGSAGTTTGDGGSSMGEAGASMAAAAGSNAGGSAGAGGASGCDALCEISLDCDNDDFGQCVATCENSAELCPEQSDDVIECSLGRPESDFECGSDGVTVLGAGVCDAESTALLRCLFL